MNFIARAKEILLAPGSAWPVIAAEETSATTLYTQYLMPLAVIPAVAGFVGMSLIGVGGFGVSIRVPVLTGLVQMVLGYGISLAMVYAMALIANALAPGFSGQKNPMNALKLVVYSSTAAMAGGVFALIPALGMLMLVAGAYSLYLLFRGVPTLMRVPSEKALPYTAVLIVCAILLSAAVGVGLGAVHGGPASIGSLGTGSGLGAPTAQFTIDTPQGAISVDTARIGGTGTPGETEFTIDTPNGVVKVDTAKMEAWNKRMEAISERLEKAQRSGDQVAMEQAFKAMAEMQKEHPLAR